MKITPTVGRIVYFNPNGMRLASHLAGPERGGALAAIIAAVQHDGDLNLAMFDATGQMFGQTGVRLVQEGEQEPMPGIGFAYWMPYQLAQAGIKPMDESRTGAGSNSLGQTNAGQNGITSLEHHRSEALEAALRTADMHGQDDVLKAARSYEQYLLGQDVVPQLATVPAPAAGADFPHVAEQFPELAQRLAKDCAKRPAVALVPAPAAAGEAPKVDAARIDALMASLTYETAHVPGTTSTVSTARLPGGFVVAIGHSACVAAENFDAAKGRKFAIEDAERAARGKLWSFEGYALYLRLEQLRAAGIDTTMPAHHQRVMLEKLELDSRRNGLAVFVETSGDQGSIFDTLPQAEQDRLRAQLVAQSDLSDILGERIANFSKVQA